MADFSLTYQMILLELCERARTPLSNAQISDFTASLDFMDYFTTQETLHGLVDADMLTVESTHNHTLYRATEKAREALRQYHAEVPPDIRESINAYLRHNQLAIRQDNALTANYRPSGDGGYLCSLRVLENDRIILSLLLHVSSEAAAEAVCTNWRARHAQVHETILDQLLS